MFNFYNDSMSANSMLKSPILNASQPRWTLVFDSMAWLLVVPN
jgi:hypothetical protein